jgi:spore maturation protein CgeB
MEQECLATIAETKPQMLWILSQAFLSSPALHALRQHGMLTAFWFCEDYRLYPWKETALSVDAFFPLQGGPFTGSLRAAGVKVQAPLPACAALEACRQPLRAASSKALTFFGYPYKNRVRVFEALGDFPLEIYGERWDEFASALLKPMIKDTSRMNEAQGIELFLQTAVNLNLHSSEFHNGVDPDGDYVNPRTFEIAACGGFQICDRRRDLPAAFEEGTEIEAFSSVAELKGKLDRWLADEQGRRLIGEAARQRVLAEHTYEHRLKTVMKTLGIPIGTASLF